jgi:hypothetical protein
MIAKKLKEAGFVLWMKTKKFPKWEQHLTGPDDDALWASASALEWDEYPRGTVFALTRSGGNPDKAEDRLCWVDYGSDS